jgi:phage-related tail protein
MTMNIKMKQVNYIHVLVSAMMIIMAGFLASCSTTGMQRSEKAGASMNDVENDINKAILQMEATNASLQDLERPGQSNVTKAFDKYSDNVDKMEKHGKRMLEHAEKMHEQGKDYFDEWRTEGNAYKNPEIQALSEQRRADLSEIFADISSASVGIKGSFKAYMSDNSEIRTYLSNDLTPKGIESISAVADKAIHDGENLKGAAQPVLTALDRAKAELAHGSVN